MGIRNDLSSLQSLVLVTADVAEIYLNAAYHQSVDSMPGAQGIRIFSTVHRSLDPKPLILQQDSEDIGK